MNIRVIIKQLNDRNGREGEDLVSEVMHFLKTHEYLSKEELVSAEIEVRERILGS